MGKVKRGLPRTLFGRALLMLTVPLVVVQLVTSFMFYDRHWQTISRRLALGLGGEIAVLIEARERLPREDQRLIAHQLRTQLEVETSFDPGARLTDSSSALLPYRSVIERALAERILMPFVLDETSDGFIAIHVQLPDGVLTAVTTDKRVFSTTTWLFTAWTIGLSLILLGIAMLFLRNLVRPITRLASAAQAFGKGQGIGDYRPSGAAEIRQAGTAFLAMRQRIERQITQRNALLAGVSADLRAPLARMAGTLDALAPVAEVAELQRDVAEMTRMIDGYLAFIQGGAGEPPAPVRLDLLFAELAADARRQGRQITAEVPAGLALIARPQALKRCLANLVDNGLRYGRNVTLTGWAQDGGVKIAVDDDGPGIPPDRREDVFRPFMRLDPSRNQATGGIGLGLTIARDVARSHGGDLTLGRATAGGLRALVYLPA